MGSIVMAQCICGYQREMYLGGGWVNFRNHCNFPLYCGACKSLFEGNIFEKGIRCPECGDRNVLRYDDDELCANKGTVVFDWFVREKIDKVLQLTNGEYLCPSCGQYNLSFYVAGYWD